MAVSREVASHQGQQEIVDAINGFTLSGVAQKAVWFDSVSSMQRANIPAGATAATRGYYTVNDGGNAFYYIREKTQSDVEDGGHIIFLDNDNVAEIIAPKDTAESYGIIAGSVDYATANADRIQALCHNHISDGVTILFGEGTYYFDDYIPLASNSAFCGVNQFKSCLVFSSESGIKTDRSNIYYQKFLIKNLTITADIPLDFSTPILEMYHCKFDSLSLNGDQVCVKGPDTGRSINNGTFMFHVEFYKIYLNSNYYGFYNMVAGNTCFYEDIVDLGKEKIMFYNTSGVFRNINCSYNSPTLDHVWYFKRLFTAYTISVYCSDSNLEDIKKSFIYVEDDENYGLAVIQFENVTMSCYHGDNPIVKTTDPILKLGTISVIDMHNCSLNYYEETREEGTPHISFYRSNGDNYRINVAPQWTIYSRYFSRWYPSTPVYDTVRGVANVYDYVNKYNGVTVDYVYGRRFHAETDIVVTGAIVDMPSLTDIYNIKDTSTATTLTVFKGQYLTGLKVGQVVTIVNKTASTFNLNAHATPTTNYTFNTSKALAPNGAASYVLAYNGTNYTWINIA